MKGRALSRDAAAAAHESTRGQPLSQQPRELAASAETTPLRVDARAGLSERLRRPFPAHPRCPPCGAAPYIDMAAILRVRLVHSSYPSTRLLSYRRPCEPCEGLTSTCRLESIASGLASHQQPRFSLRCRGLRHFRRIPGTSLRLDRQELNLRPSSFKDDALPTELLATYGDVRSLLLADLLSQRIQHTACLSPRGLLDRPLRAACLLRSPRPTRSARRPRLRGSDYARYPFRYSMASWLSQAGRHHAFPVPVPPFPQPCGRGGQTPVLCLTLTSRLEPPLGKTTRHLWRLGELA